MTRFIALTDHEGHRRRPCSDAVRVRAQPGRHGARRSRRRCWHPGAHDHRRGITRRLCHRDDPRRSRIGTRGPPEGRTVSRAKGGAVRGSSRDSDSVPMMLTPGTPPEVARRVGRLYERGLAAHLCDDVLIAADGDLLEELERLADEELRQLNQHGHSYSGCSAMSCPRPCSERRTSMTRPSTT
jgi:hypothetical protein